MKTIYDDRSNSDPEDQDIQKDKKIVLEKQHSNIQRRNSMTSLPSYILLPHSIPK
jgi:hypothetical protein